MKQDISALVRVADIEDADGMLAIQKQVVSEGNFLISVPEESNNWTIVDQKESIQRKLENERETILVAVINNEVVGWIDFSSEAPKRLAHTGSFCMMVAEKYRGIGIGKQLLITLLEWVKQNPNIEKVGLGVFSSNHKAISLYKSMGFREEGRRIKDIKLDDETYVDDVLMYQFVK